MIIRSICIAIILILGGDLLGQDLTNAIEKSQILYKEKKYDEAIAKLESAIANDNGEIPSTVVEARLWLARNYMHSWQTQAAKKEYAKAWEQSKKLENDSLSIQAGMSLIVMIGFQEKPDSLKFLIEELLEYENLDYSQKSNLYIELAGYYEDTEKIDSAIYYATKAAEIDSIHQDSSSIPYTYYDLGNFHVYNFDYTAGITKILYGLEFLRGEKDEHKRNTIELGLSNIYLRIGNVSKAEQLATRAYKSSKELGHQVALTNAFNSLGNCASYLDQYEKALKYYLQSDSTNSSKSKNIWRGLRAKVSIIDQKLNLKQDISDDDLMYINEINTESVSNVIKNSIEFIKLRVGNYSESEFEIIYDRLYKSSGAKDNFGLRKRLLKIKQEYLTNSGDFEQALSIAGDLDKMKRDVTIANNEYIIQDLEAVHRKKEQQIQISYLDEQNISKQKIVEEQKTKIALGSIALALITLLSFFLYRLYRQVRSQKQIIAKALSEKDLLLREIHHRVKNNLQLVSSLLTLQGRSIDDETVLQAINEGKSRVRSMALIHQDLYNKENLTGISVKQYTEKLTQELFDTYIVDKERITLQTDIDDIDLDVDTLVPLGLIINELITNSLKYAWPNNEMGVLSIGLHRAPDRIILTVKDDGIGHDPTAARDDTFGSTLISALTLQLNGECTTTTDNGSILTITIDTSDLP